MIAYQYMVLLVSSGSDQQEYVAGTGEGTSPLRRENERIIQGLIQCLSSMYVYSVIPKKR